MIKQIFHISDIHIRRNLLHDLYKTQFQRFIDEVKTKTVNFFHDEIRIVITGDLAHEKINISNEQIILTSWFLNELSKLGKLILIPGNHDFLENNQERVDSITPIVTLLNNPNITYYKDSGVYDDDNIRWVVYSLYQENIKPDFENTSTEFLYVGLFHGPIRGLSTDLGYTFETAYDPLNFVGCDIVLCGDIHRRQKINLLNGNSAIMIGSFIQNNFGETIKHHGYGIYDVSEDEYTFFDLPNEQPFMYFRINDIKDIEHGKETLVNLG